MESVNRRLSSLHCDICLWSGYYSEIQQYSFNQRWTKVCHFGLIFFFIYSLSFIQYQYLLTTIYIDCYSATEFINCASENLLKSCGVFQKQSYTKPFGFFFVMFVMCMIVYLCVGMRVFVCVHV